MTDNNPKAHSVGVSAANKTNDLRDHFRLFFGHERLIVSCVLGLLVVFSVFDFFEDSSEGASWPALLSDISDTFLPILLLLYIWRFKPLFHLHKSVSLETDLASKNADLQLWKSKASQYIKGLSESIDTQLSDWHLTRAEKEVAMLLLKGFSLRDLAELRGTSERTVRQQATKIYEKAGLRGRAELSAFFLEDLMLPDGAGH